jgi:hypothetical protein
MGLLMKITGKNSKRHHLKLVCRVVKRGLKVERDLLVENLHDHLVVEE